MKCTRADMPCTPDPSEGYRPCSVHDGLISDETTPKCHAADSDCKVDWNNKNRCYWHMGEFTKQEGKR